jgi:uroporphyrinogen decarboxylase
MTREERLLKLVNREPVDYLPSQITFSDRSRNAQIAMSLGLDSEGDLEDYLENHIELVFPKYDLPLFYRNDIALMRELDNEGVAGLDEAGSTVYDIWGMGIQIGEAGFYFNYSPFKGDREANEKARPFLPESFDTSVWEKDTLSAINSFIIPDPAANGNLDNISRELAKYRSQGIYSTPSGYFGIWERGNGMLGFEENMMHMACEPEISRAMFEKITEYKIRVAKEYLKYDLPIYHHGDDLGFQTSTFFSEKMFCDMLLPHLKKLFRVYKDACKKIAYHSCGNITKLIPHLIDIGVDILEPVQPCMDLKFLKKEFGKDIIFWGGIDTQYILPFGKPAEVREHTRDVIRVLGRGGGLIIAPSQEIMPDVPIENIKAMLETIKEERAKVLD